MPCWLEGFFQPNFPIAAPIDGIRSRVLGSDRPRILAFRTAEHRRGPDEGIRTPDTNRNCTPSGRSADALSTIILKSRRALTVIKAPTEAALAAHAASPRIPDSPRASVESSRGYRPLGGQVRASLLHSRCATAVIALDRRARDRAIGAEYATVASEGLKPRPAALAVIEEDAGIGRHRLDGLMAA